MEIIDVCKQFRFDGDFVSCKEFGSGHINKTYIAEYNDNGHTQNYVVQRVNNNVFKNIDDLMNNLFAVTSYLRDVITKNGGDPDRETLHYIRTKDGDKYLKADDGGFYRAYIFVKDSISYDSVDSAETFMSSGVAFGRFQRLLSDFDADTLAETIPNFHNTPWRYENECMPAVQRDAVGRKSSCIQLIDDYISRRSVMSRLTDMIDSGELPLRVTHNDTKLNNVMLDNDTNKALCVIDLDTIMPGSMLFDYGDAIRSGANAGLEDDVNLKNVYLDKNKFEAYTRGFVSEMAPIMTDSEAKMLAQSPIVLTYELGLRFLTDYLDGNKYFKCDLTRPKHNLERAKAQFTLTQDLIKNYSYMNKFAGEIYNEYKFDNSKQK